MKKVRFLLFSGLIFAGVSGAHAETIQGLHLSFGAEFDARNSLEVEAGVGGGKILLGSVGGYRRLDGDDKDWLATFGLGLRF